MADRLRIAGVVPFLDEARHLPRFLASLATQTRPLEQLILVDDGSRDGSDLIAQEFAAQHPTVTALRRPPRPPRRDRLATADELQAFLWGVGHVAEPWDVVAKLDADLDLPANAIAFLAQRLEEDPRLGLAGSYLTEEDAQGHRTRLRIRPEHVHGATKFYRRACFEDIAPLPPTLGWDTLDEVTARVRGWRTQSFAIPGGDPLHLRPRASYDGVARGFRRSGQGAWLIGHHPLHVLLYGLRHMTEAPGVSGGLNYLAGWSLAALRRLPRGADPEVRAYIRQDELARIRQRLVAAARGARFPAVS